MRARLLTALAVSLLFAGGAYGKSFVTFESGPVRPMALSASGTQLFVANIPDNRLELFYVGGNGALAYRGSVPVGMEPVAVAVRNESEVWVVNHLSDSVSIVDVGSTPPRVVRTLLVGDEPRDIVFASGRAFITTAHRGQQRTNPTIAAVPGAGDPELTTPGVPRADVWVFNASNPGAAFGGVPLKIVELFGDTPRALATDGTTVWAAVFQSGNQTTTVNEGVVCDGFASASSCSGDGITSPNGLAGGDLPGGNPGPDRNHASDPNYPGGAVAPEVGLIVKYDQSSGEWQDEGGRNWSNGVRFFLPDHDVFAIDAGTLNQTSQYDHVGTILFNMAVNPGNGKVYVTNADSQNLTRFEGGGVFGGSTVQGNLAHYRISVLSGASTVEPRHLNKHITDYSITPAPAGIKQHSLATPLDMVFDPTGTTLYVAAFGSSKIGVFQTATLENDTFNPTTQSSQYIPVSGGGPCGLALKGDRLYVYNRFSNSVSIVDTVAGAEVGSLPLSDPEPANVVVGRPVLYDAQKTSSNGEASCSSCHVFGDLDSLAWDLGDPDTDVSANPMDFTPAPIAGNVNGDAADDEFHPMKGAMTTQTLRGLANSGGMHWRGDRTNGFFGLDDPYVTGGGADVGDEVLNFANFIVAVSGLVGSATPPSDAQLQADMLDFASFALEIALPPNPVANLDGTLTAQQTAGRTIFLNRNIDVVTTCEGCHTLQPENGFFGTGGLSSFEGETQTVKVPHLRNLYQKVGMFGMPDSPFFNAGDNAHKGDQVRGFGFLHDGSTDSVFRFLQAGVFSLLPAPFGFANDTERRNVEQFMLAFPSDLAPIVGQQITDDGSVDSDRNTRISLMRTRAGTDFVSKYLGGTVANPVKECDLIVKGSVGGEERGYLWDPGSGSYDSDRVAETGLSQVALDTLADTAGNFLTYTCAPPGSGVRMGIDQDLDGALDSDERDAGTDPANAGSISGACNDSVDNDGDGLTDLADPGCANPSGNVENPQCSNGVDDDGDGQVDALDAECASPADPTENATGGGHGCGLGLEGAIALLPLMALRRRRRSR